MVEPPMVELIIIGLNHKTAPIDIRERLAFQESEIEKALAQVHSLPSLKENMILSTCNRVEIYANLPGGRTIDCRT